MQTLEKIEDAFFLQPHARDFFTIEGEEMTINGKRAYSVNGGQGIAVIFEDWKKDPKEVFLVHAIYRFGLHEGSGLNPVIGCAAWANKESLVIIYEEKKATLKDTSKIKRAGFKVKEKKKKEHTFYSDVLDFQHPSLTKDPILRLFSEHRLEELTPRLPVFSFSLS